MKSLRIVRLIAVREASWVWLGILLIVMLSDHAFCQDTTVFCTDHSCSGSTVMPDGKTVVQSECGEHGCSERVIDRDSNYTQRLCLSCTDDETARSRTQLRMCFSVDFAFCNSLFAENDVALRIEMQRASIILHRLQIH